MSERKGHRRLRLFSCKNYERNKYTPMILPVFIPLTVISLPLLAIPEAPLNSLEVLKTRIGMKGLSTDWREQWQNGALTMYKLLSRGSTLEISFSVCVKEDMTYTISFKGKVIDMHKCAVLAQLPSCVDSLATLDLLLNTVSTSILCVGNHDEKFLALPNIRGGVLRDSSGSQVVATIDSSRTGSPSIFHTDCEVLVSSKVESRRCSSCNRHRNSLRAMLARPSKDERTHPSSHMNYSVLSTPDKEERLHRSHLETKKRKLREDRLM